MEKNKQINENQIEGNGINERKEIKELIKRGFDLDDDGKVKAFNGNYFAKYIKESLDIIYSKDGYFYIYDSTVWVKKNEIDILKMLRDILQEPRFGVWSKRREREYVEALKLEVFYSKKLNPNKDIINMSNGMYNLDTFQFIEHDKKYMSTIQIPVEYIENAKCPRFLKFIDEVFEYDGQRIRVCQEWFGYSITIETKAQKALILYGSGGNGKGVLIEILSFIIGADNISHIPLNELSKGFSRVCLHNKTANISNENESNGKAFNTQYFKAIVGQDTINAEQKGKPVFSFKPTTKLILSMNNLPHTSDKSEGYYRRLSILEFTAQFTEKNRDEGLKEKLKEELSGIFLWAIEGLKRLKENNYKFTKSENMEKNLEEYKIEQNPIILFFDECIEEAEEEYREENKVILNAFKKWATDNGYSGYYNISPNKFWREFKAVAKSEGMEIKQGRNNKLRYSKGIRLIQTRKIKRNVKSPKIQAI
ncbi:DNA primase family protein [Oceanirhabdus sp. W0125-5]|uniref:DNA primase family protein n=1 Tax=Oceanirhabdus sp. W0125-5 TaxID=2999116 RepID=UPI0022F32D7D|nr:phage/plasmid primase, P4 family [Oceanirhabdus sp. W0125-5]WBW95939.1 phage/plasmid primase, P4 family [Oceanirhabdus sp. W0125-5]